MNRVHKQLLALVALAGISQQIVSSPEYDLKSMIGDPIVLKINQNRTDKKDYYQILFPGKTVKQTYPAGNAYLLATNGLQWAPLDKTAPFNGGLDFVDPVNGRIPENKQREFGDKIAHNYVFLHMDIIMQPNEVYQEISKAASQLLKGIDSFACQTIDTAKALSTQGSSSSGGGSSGGFSGGLNINMPGSEKPAKQDKEMQLIDLLEQLQTMLSSIEFDKKDETDQKIKQKNALDRAKMANQLNTLLTSDKIKLLKDVGKLQIQNISKIKSATIGIGNRDDALRSINDALEDIALKERKINIDTDAGKNINTLMSMGGGSSYSSSPSSQSPTSAKACDFGLGTIGKASAKLAGSALTSREFIIYYKVDADGIPVIDKFGRPVLTATTVQGQ